LPAVDQLDACPLETGNQRDAWLIVFAFPHLRTTISATIPTIAALAILYAVTAQRDARLSPTMKTPEALRPTG
jgi:hypothetical protein